MLKNGIIAAVLACMLVGCGYDENRFMSTNRLNRGLILILPGIEGKSPLNTSILRGLDEAYVSRAMTVFPWGFPIPIAGALVNQMDVTRNRLKGEEIARSIIQYKQIYPDHPVYIIGHSGGGGIAVFVAEGLPEGTTLDGLVLLSASISSDYDLTKALNHSRNGILNVYNRGDGALLGIGTTVIGNVDGVRSPSAGLAGFSKPPSSATADQKLAYKKLYQIEMGSGIGTMIDPHTSSTRVRFISDVIAPWVAGTTWPPKRGAFELVDQQ